MDIWHCIIKSSAILMVKNRMSSNMAQFASVLLYLFGL